MVRQSALGNDSRLIVNPFSQRFGVVFKVRRAIRTVISHNILAGAVRGFHRWVYGIKSFIIMNVSDYVPFRAAARRKSIQLCRLFADSIREVLRLIVRFGKALAVV